MKKPKEGFPLKQTEPFTTNSIRLLTYLAMFLLGVLFGQITAYAMPNDVGVEKTNRIEASKEKISHVCVKHTAGDDQNQYVRIASKISNNDLNFLALLDAENGLFSPDRIGATGDKGFCQISPKWHPEITSDPRFTDPKWQLEQCFRLYKNGTTFYAKKLVWKTKKHFTCPEWQT